MQVNRVYKFGCRQPLQEALALQLLGQASNYREDLRRVYNAHKRRVRDFFSAEAEASHVRVFESVTTDENAHVLVRDKFLFWEKLSEINNENIRTARKNRGHLLDAGTYWLIESEVLAASKAVGNDLIKRKPFDWTGRIGAAIQSTEKFATTSFNHKRVCIVRNEDKRKYHLLTIKVGELKEKRSITFPIFLHRAFPAGAIVKQVAIQRIRVGHRFRWEALITIAFDQVIQDEDINGTVGIDIGWRKEENGTRVATWDGIRDGEENKGTLVTTVLSEFEYADAVRSIRDKNFDEAKAYAADNIVGAEHARQWKNKARLVRIADKTNDFGAIWWRERDRHLEDIEAGVRTHAMHRRLYLYRQFADSLAKRYQYVSLEDMPMSDFVGESETHAKERKRSSAALYMLQLVIAHRFGPERTNWCPAEYTSMICSCCNMQREVPVGPQSHWTCDKCGTEHHQDKNAAIIIRRSCEQWIDEGNTVRARGRKSMKGKRKEVVRQVA